MLSVLLFQSLTYIIMLCYLSFNSQTVNFSLNIFVSALYFYFLAFDPVVSYFVALVSVYLIFFLTFSLLCTFKVF